MPFILTDHSCVVFIVFILSLSIAIVPRFLRTIAVIVVFILAFVSSDCYDYLLLFPSTTV